MGQKRCPGRRTVAKEDKNEEKTSCMMQGDSFQNCSTTHILRTLFHSIILEQGFLPQLVDDLDYDIAAVHGVEVQAVDAVL